MSIFDFVSQTLRQEEHAAQWAFRMDCNATQERSALVHRSFMTLILL